MATETCGSGYGAGPWSQVEDLLAFQRSLDHALASALTKFDSISTYFSDGMTVQAVAEMLAQEIRQDEDFIPYVKTPSHDEQLRKFVTQMVGKSFGLWKKGAGSRSSAAAACESGRGTDSGLGWSSIDNYPGWVYEQILAYLGAEPGSKVLMRMELEKALLEEPLCSATVKYDGTCFGKMDDGSLSGRRHLVGKACENYLNTSTAACQSCDIELVRAELSRRLDVELACRSVCVWGELMCNPGYYGYLARGLADKWISFGAVVQLPRTEDEGDIMAWSEKLTQLGFAHSVAPEGRKVRLFLCPALRELLTQAGCQVADDVGPATHAELVASNARSLIEGQNEGLVLVFRRFGGGQASVRKWKNSAEGPSSKHAQQLRLLGIRSLADEGLIDARIADMVETMIQVAEAATTVPKLGRKQLPKA